MNAPRWFKASLIACVAAAPLSTAASRAARQDPAKVQPTDSAAQVRRPAPPRTLTVTVMDGRGRYVTGLRPEMFTVFDGGRPSEVVSVVFGDAPATVGVVLDASGSMLTDASGRRGPLVVRNALLRFFRNCNASDEFFLIAFNDSPQLLLGESNDSAAVLAALDRFAASEPKGHTALFDALYLALSRAERGRHAKRAVLLVTDGQDNSSHYKLSEVRRLLKESDVTLYAVALFGAEDSVLNLEGRAVLEELTRISGGRAIFPAELKDVYAAMEVVADELRNQYTVGFVPAPTSKKDGWHGVRVRVGELRDAGGKKFTPTLRVREGFYDAPPR